MEDRSTAGRDPDATEARLSEGCVGGGDVSETLTWPWAGRVAEPAGDGTDPGPDDAITIEDADDVDGEVEDYVRIPEGTYLCVIAEVRVGETKAGDARWGLRLVVDEGEYTGTLAGWDGLVFSTRGLARVRRVLGALGLPSRGRLSITPRQIQGRRVFAEFRTTEFVHPATKRTTRRLEVPYDGYLPVPGDREAGRSGSVTGGHDSDTGDDPEDLPGDHAAGRTGERDTDPGPGDIPF